MLIKRSFGRTMLVTLAMVLSLTACGKGELPQEQESHTAVHTKILDDIVNGDYEWHDNTKDAYIAILNKRIATFTSMNNNDLNVVPGLKYGFLGANTGHIFEEWGYKGEDGIINHSKYAFVSSSEMKEEVLSEDAKLKIVGACNDSDNTLRILYRDGEVYLLEADSNGDIVAQLQLEFLQGKVHNIQKMQKDTEGAYHVLIYEVPYVDGEVIGDLAPAYYYYHPENAKWMRFQPEEGEVRCLLHLQHGKMGVEVTADKKQYLYAFEVGKETPECIAEVFDLLDDAAFVDEETYFYADQSGVYRKHITDEEGTPIYIFANHGILAKAIHDINYAGNRLDLICENEDGIAYYLQLQPAEGQISTVEITLAASPSSEIFFKTAAAEFNRQFPNYYITITTDKDWETLQREAANGEGPVLYDSWALPFEKNKKVFMPLNPYMNWLTDEGDFFENVLEIGMEGDIQYGIPIQFSLRTMAVRAENAKDWDYDTFLKEYSKHPEMLLSNADHGAYELIMKLLIRAEDDSCFWDVNKQESYFSKKKDILEMVKTTMDKNRDIFAGRSLVDGEVFCNLIGINRPENLEVSRFYYGDEAVYTGYPTKDGAAHFVEETNIVCIRDSAGEEEKAAAVAFLKVLLSYEGQRAAVKNDYFNLSVRKDVFDEQCDQYSTSQPFVYAPYFEMTSIDKYDKEWCKKKIYDLIDHARPSRGLPSELSQILIDELDLYFTGKQSLDVTTNHLDNRISLYLQE